MLARLVGLFALVGMVAFPGCQWKERGCWSFIGCFNETPVGPTPINFVVEPPLDSASVLRVGDERRFEAHLYGEGATTTVVRWNSDNWAVAGWFLYVAPCPNGRCATLRALSPGSAYVTVEYCSLVAGGSDCRRYGAQVRVDP